MFGTWCQLSPSALGFVWRWRWRSASAPAMSVLFLLLLATRLPSWCGAGYVIPPSWASHRHNPCAALSWQQILWPEDGRCYPIFRQGPCPPSQELVWHTEQRRAVCACPRGHLLHSASDTCFRQHTRGPCPSRHFFDHNQQDDVISVQKRLGNRRLSDEHSKKPYCHPYNECPLGHLFWPPTRTCHPHLSRGPCSQGELLFVNSTDLETGSGGESQCGCERSLMLANYWPHTDSCYEQHTRGPCVNGLIFVYSADEQRTQCVCSSDMVQHYHAPTGQCYQPGTRGPCPLGAMFIYSAEQSRTLCTCMPGALLWSETGQCYHAYTQGPCALGELITPLSGQYPIESRNDNSITVRFDSDRQVVTEKDDEGTGALASPFGHCTLLPCRRGELFFPERDACFRIGRRGPCSLGELVMYEQYRGVSQRGACGCSRDFTHNYWPLDGRCYQLFTRGPCPPLFTFVFNSTSDQPQCVCDERRGRALYAATGQCHELYRRGPCPPGQTLTRTMLGAVVCSCKDGLVYDQSAERCRPHQHSDMFNSIGMLNLLR